jgi:hypothetical protein
MLFCAASSTSPTCSFGAAATSASSCRTAPALDPRRLVQPVARRRLATVRAVQPQTPLKFGDLRFSAPQFRLFGPPLAQSVLPRDGSGAESGFIESLNRETRFRCPEDSTRLTSQIPQPNPGSYPINKDISRVRFHLPLVAE